MTHGEVLALVGGGALMVGGGVALWMLSRSTAGAPPAPTASTPTSASAAPSTATSGPTVGQVINLWQYQGNGCWKALAGATLSGLSVTVGIPYASLAAMNGIANPNVIQIGQTVCTTGSAPPAASGGTSACRLRYTVPAYTGTNALQATLGGIAIQFGTTVDALIQANRSTYPTISPNYVQAGWTLCIP